MAVIYATCGESIPDTQPPARTCHWAGRVVPGFWECPNCGALHHDVEESA